MNKLSLQYLFKRGFTLIELLVVISIISLLSSVVISNLNCAHAKSRDARRKLDLHQMEIGLELYYGKYGGYPWDGTGGWEQTCKTTTNDIGKIVTEGYISVLPCDPLNTGAAGSGYGYYFDPNGTVGGSGCEPTGTCSEFCLWAPLENGHIYTVTEGGYVGCPTG